MARAVYIHAGAHRTGTSSFQMCLWENRELLAQQGLEPAYPGRDGVPGGRLRLRLPRPRHGDKRIPAHAEAVRDHLAKICPDQARDLILSEENIPGPMRHFADGRFYPAAAKRARTLATALEHPPRHLIYVIRPYADLYLSAYRKRAEDNPVAPFADLVPALMAMDRGWPELLADLRDQLNPNRMTVLTYAQRGESRVLLARLLGRVQAESLAEPAVPVNQSATDAALIALQARYRAGEVLKRADWKAVIAEHAGDTAPAGFAAFSADDRARLDARYAKDLDRVATMTGLSLA